MADTDEAQPSTSRTANEQVNQEFYIYEVMNKEGIWKTAYELRLKTIAEKIYLRIP